VSFFCNLSKGTADGNYQYEFQRSPGEQTSRVNSTDAGQQDEAGRDVELHDVGLVKDAGL